MIKSAVLALEDGSIFYGTSIGVNGTQVGEVVFNTSASGYQEIITDPSYSNQLVALTSPHIGNTGINSLDAESSYVCASALIIKDASITHSNWRSQESLSDYLVRQNIVAISGIDTRKLTNILRKKGALKGCIIANTNKKIDINIAIEDAKKSPSLKGVDLAKKVSTNSVYKWNQGTWDLENNKYPTIHNHQYHVVAYDFGIKKNILRMLSQRKCLLTVMPAQTPADEIMSLNPDGIFLSNGPGDPSSCDYAIEAIKILLNKKIPIFGICLGHQLLALACGAKTEKMKLGHHGTNHPVQDLNTKKVMITSQNHGFTVSENDLPNHIEITHKSLFDNSIQGIRLKDRPAFGFQGHPEANPGPQDANYLFDDFISQIKHHKL